MNAAARTSSAARSVADPARLPSTPPGGTDQPDAEAADVTPSRPVLVPEPTTSDLVDEAVARWRAGLVELAGGSSLADVSLLGDAVVDLTAAHPSGVAQLFAGRPTRLSNLFREGGSLPAARRRARAVVVRAAEHAQRYGVAPTYLAIGVATWTQSPTAPLAEDDVAALARVAGRAPTVVPGDGDANGPADAEPAATGPDAADAPLARPGDPSDVVPGPEEDPAPRTVRAPVLLRPLTVTPRGDGETDYELTLEPTAEINPLLARTLRAHGALLDPVTLARSTFTGAGFDPGDATRRIAALGQAVLDDFDLTHRVLVGTFVHPGQVLVDDLDELAPALERHEVVAALAGDERSAAALRADLPAPRVGDADPVLERGAGDLDPSQRHVVDVLASGSHLFVDAPTGSDVAGTLAAVVAEAAASGRHVLYVPGHRRAADALLARLDALGLGGLALDVAPEPTWRETASHRLLAAMATEPEPVEDDDLVRTRDALLGARARLAGYIEALHLVRDPWGVSAYDALQALARLTAERPAPDTRVRLTTEVVLAVGPQRERVAAELREAAMLGAFTARATSTPWYGAALSTPQEAHDALVRVERLRAHTLPQLRAQVEQVAERTGLTTATTLRQWGDQLTMLGGMRGTLDVFQPLIFERTAQDMVEATATKQWREQHGIEMGWFARRRLRRQARDMVRPGVRVPDLHAALVEVQAQRAVWQEQCPRGGWPVLPEGLSAIEDTHEAVRIDAEELEPVLAGTPAGGGLLDVPLDALAARLDALAEDAAALDALPARTAIQHRLTDLGLGELLTDLAARRVEADEVGPELELAWWSSVFEQILAQDQALAGQDGAGLDALARRFRELDRAHVASLAAPVRAAVRDHLGTAMREHRDEAEALFTELLEGRLVSLRETAEQHPAVLRRLRPVLVATPTLVPHLVPATRTVDLVVLDAIEHTPVELVLSALARGRQVVAVGDPRAASTDTVRELAELLPTVALLADGSRRDPFVTTFLAEHGYAGVLRPSPLPRAEVLVQLDVVDGAGMPDTASGAVESTQAEVDRVVEVAIEHALTRPDESLAIITVTPLHADRIRDALLVEVRQNPALAGFFSGARAEPVVVADVSGVAGLVRDTIVLSVGFGRTPHGRVLHRFGILNTPGAEAMLLDSVGATRRRLHVVSCFTAGDLDPERLRGAGARLLAEVLDLAEQRSGAADQVTLGNGVDLGGSPDRLVLDLAERLWRAGLVVETDYGIGDGDRIPLVVGHPDLPGELLVAVLTDDAAYVAERSVRVRDRQVAERLERIGWTVAQVWSAAAFLDPAKEAERIRRVVQAVRDARLPETGGVAQTGGGDRIVVVPVIDDDEQHGDEDL
ncbi:hypothetical protein G8C93_04250 [Cellulosimicrobium cellulans]|nr:hypothetical protein [Cellulosimicrobium cellulans]